MNIDEKIMQQLRKKQEFTRLFNGAKVLNYASFNDAELAICKIIASVTTDPEMIDAIFKGSSLYRPQVWDKNDYGNNVIQKALLAIQTKNNTPYFITITKSGKTTSETIDTTQLAKWMNEKVQSLFVKNEMSNSTTIYVFRNGKYQICSEKTYMGLIKQEIEKYNSKLVTTRIVNEAFNLLLMDSTEGVSADSFNRDENAINFKNGLLKLDTMELVPHSAEYLSTIQIPCAWNGKDSPTPVFDNYLDTLTNGDDEMKNFLLQVIGICLSNIYGYRFKKGFFLLGEGNTGKSQLRSLIELLLGENNCFTTSLGSLESRFGPSNIFQKRMIGTADMGFISVDELEIYKQLTGGDTIQADVKYRAAFCFVYRGVMLFCTNRLPHFSGDTGTWVYDRFSIVKCNNVIPEDKRDPEILEKMFQEREGIVYKAIMALRQYVITPTGYRLVEPQKVIDARKEYAKQNSVVVSFFKECMIPSAGIPQNKIFTSTEIFRAFIRWCKCNNNGYHPNNAQFKNELANHLGTTVDKLMTHTNQGNIVAGYTLSEDAWRLYA